MHSFNGIVTLNPLKGNFFASWINAAIEGDASISVNGLGKIETAQPNELSFIANPKYESFAYTTKASALLVGLQFTATQPLTATLLRVPGPYAAMAVLLEKFSQQLHPQSLHESPCFIHPTAKIGENLYIGAFAYIGEGAVIGNGVKIYPGSYIGPHVTINENTIVYAGVKIYYGCKIGSNCILHAGCVIGSDGFGFAPRPDGSYQKIAQNGIVVVGNEVEIGANTVIARATMGETTIAEGVKLDNLIQIAHNVTIGQHTVIASQTGVSGSTELGKYCTIGGQAGFVGHIKIADYTKIGAQSGVSKNIDTPNQVWNGSPAAEFRQNMRLLAAMRKLPDLIEKIANLERQIAKKEG